MEYAYMSNEEYDRKLGRRGSGLSPLMLLLLIGGIVVALPGMAIFAAAADVFSLTLERSKGWGISVGLSVAIFVVMRLLASSFKEAGKAYLSLSGIIALLFVVVHFGLQLPFAARWTAVFMPEGNGTRLSSGAVAAHDQAAPVSLPTPQPGASMAANSVPVRRAVPVVDDAPAAPQMMVPPLAAAPIPALQVTGQARKYLITGIPVSDTLNVRAGPGENFAKVRELRPDYDKIAAVSAPQMNGDTAWVLITFENQSGWVAGQFIRAE